MSSWNGKKVQQRVLEQKWKNLVAQETTTFRFGPFPDADELHKYDSIDPTLVDRIFSYAEREQRARIKSADRALLIEFFKDMFGLGISAISVGGLAYFSYILIKNGQSTAGIAVLMTEIIGVIYAFRWYKKPKAPETK